MVFCLVLTKTAIIQPALCLKKKCFELVVDQLRKVEKGGDSCKQEETQIIHSCARAEEDGGEHHVVR